MRSSLVVVAVIGAVAGCGRVDRVTASDPAEVQRFARITIPPSASGLHCRTEGFQDRMTYGRFDLPAADLPQFVAQMPPDGRVEGYSGYSNVTSHKTSDTWWQPGRLGKPRVAEWSPPGFSVNLMFGESERAGILTVYFFNFEL